MARYNEQTPKVNLYCAIGFNDIHDTPHDPILYHFTAFNGRLNSGGKIAHVFPAKLTQIKNCDKKIVALIGNNKIGIQIWKTRCSSPVLNLVTFDLEKKIVERFPKCTKILKNYYSDLSYKMDERSYSEMISAYTQYIEANRLYYDPKRGLHPDTKYSSKWVEVLQISTPKETNINNETSPETSSVAISDGQDKIQFPSAKKKKLINNHKINSLISKQ